MVTSGISCTLRLLGSPVKVKGGAIGSAYSIGCVSHDSPQRKSTLRENGKFGSNHTVNLSKATMRCVKSLEKKGPSEGNIYKCEPQE